MTFSRRDFLAASVAAMALPKLALPGSARAATVPLPRDIEIVVVGAGAAGIAAARRVMAANRKVVVVEASNRIGGRCWTDTETFGVPFDRGARWIYSQSTSPLARQARSVGMDVYAAPQAQKIRIGRRNARAGETEDFLATLVRTNRAIADANRKADISALEAMPRDLGEWAKMLEFTLGPATASKDLKEVSALDLARLEPRDAGAFCRQGLGALVAKLAEPVPIAIGQPVTRIIWGGRDLAVETASGRVTTRAVIVTASTNVLLSGKLKFAPDLPSRHLDAAAKLALGSYDHIALELPDNPLGLQRDDCFVEKSDSNKTGLLLANIAGTSLCTVDVGGSFGRDLSAQGEAAMVAFALEWLEKLYGSEVKAAVKRSAVTRWNASPFVLGAISAAAPGAQGSRRILMEPLGSLMFAGEAAHETLWGTVSGAWESGERAAEAALRRIGALKPDPAEQPRRKSRRRAR
ncbi:NAD(P)/FAD-dependent oxidoreductase [Bradyrhizobium sp. LHD-71]|uniref:flavin monoamine oxidase family protein n=1 Tax=Bradyrhizobium sp. LHD-71 TaxID=3072141 RepID=UPI00281009FF|nr:NAD(P)/FAD-dependent oxidoreductase [Bradyrhizobium sp. LHD-71]MDQ8732228.1 NAD(P)/FAD-dependent oxidoreductase [Bradyrhizobium sp. LHD-71]